MSVEGSAAYWANRAQWLRLWLHACVDRATVARLEAALQEAEVEEERLRGLRLYVVRRSGAAPRRRGGGRRAM